METFPRVFCFLKSRINENGGKNKLLQYCNHYDHTNKATVVVVVVVVEVEVA